MGDLRIWMAGFGLLIGLLFPFVIVLLGVPSQYALRPVFFLATIIAGLIVAAVNLALARTVVGVRLRSLASSMQHVDEALEVAAFEGDWSKMRPRCLFSRSGFRR